MSFSGLRITAQSLVLLIFVEANKNDIFEQVKGPKLSLKAPVSVGIVGVVAHFAARIRNAFASSLNSKLFRVILICRSFSSMGNMILDSYGRICKNNESECTTYDSLFLIYVYQLVDLWH